MRQFVLVADQRLWLGLPQLDRKSTRLNSSHTVIYTLSLHDALPISYGRKCTLKRPSRQLLGYAPIRSGGRSTAVARAPTARSEEHTSELQSHSDLHSFPTRRSSDLVWAKMHPKATFATTARLCANSFWWQINGCG